jgi:periplasmic divalent cation tolerance protein
MTDAQAMLIMTTVDGDDAAARLATRLIEQQQAACVQQVEIRSRYRWQGEARCEGEILLLVKTSAMAAAAAMETIQAHHPYDVPEIIALPIVAGSAAYLEWLAREAPGPAPA